MMTTQDLPEMVVDIIAVIIETKIAVTEVDLRDHLVMEIVVIVVIAVVIVIVIVVTILEAEPADLLDSIRINT